MSAKCAKYLVIGNTAFNATGQFGATFPTEQGDELLLYIRVISAPTSVTFEFQVSPDETNWYSHTAGVAMTAIGSQLIKVPNCAGKLGRVAITAVTGIGTAEIYAETKRHLG